MYTPSHSRSLSLSPSVHPDQLAGAVPGASAGAAQIKDPSGTVSESITGKGEWALFITADGYCCCVCPEQKMSDVGM